MPDSTETEVKLRLASPEEIRRKLEALGAVLVRERHLEDNLLFDDALGSLRARGGVLRLRETPHGGFLTFKGPRQEVGGMKTREERETAVGSPGQVHAILRHLGYHAVFRYQKYRESWVHRQQEIEIDETPIGAFLEIEGDVGGIAAVAAELGFRPSDYVAESYVGLFVASGGKGDMVFG
jgi:predicted adenylyl cyclase CyaB